MLVWGKMLKDLNPNAPEYEYLLGLRASTFSLEDRVSTLAKGFGLEGDAATSAA